MLVLFRYSVNQRSVNYGLILNVFFNLFLGRSTTGIIIAKLTKTIISKLPGLIHPCPYSGTFGVSNQKAGRLLNGVIPRWTSNGLYKARVRFYRKDNVTYCVINALTEIVVRK